MNTELMLHEEFMLLALKEETGTVETSESVEYPLAAAILTELFLQKKIEFISEGKKKEKVKLVDETNTHDSLLNEVLDEIAAKDKPLTVQKWVRNIANLPKLKNRIGLQLCERGILKADEDKILLIFSRKIYPEINPLPEKEILRRMRDAIFSETEDVDPRIAVLIALADQTHLLRKKFDKKELKEKKERIKKISEGSLTAKAAKEVMEAIAAAVLVAVIIPVVFSN